MPTDPFVGENVTFTLQFDNTHASQVGYGPYIDLILPATGADGAGAAADDGITFLNATYLGAAVTAQTFTFPVGGTLPHPYARNASNQPITVTGTPGHQLVVLQLPFGSFTGPQPPADIVVNVALSDQADVGTALQMQTRGGFQFGADALDNAPSDPSIFPGSFNNVNVTPTLLRLRKTYLGPESETATGPNFPRQYRIDVDVATGQVISNLAITDLLPGNLQFLTVDSTLINGGASATTATATPSTTTPGGTLTRTFTSNVTGTAGTTDATMIFSFFVPRVDDVAAVIINATTGDDVVSNNEASSSGSWDPIDPRDAVTPVTANGTSPDHVLTDKSIAIQKSVAIVNDTGVAGYSPGDTLQYTLTAQISDYFAFQNLVVTDTLGDGLREDGTFTPTLSVSEHGSPSAGNINVANFSFTFSGVTGETTGLFNVSDELVTRAENASILGGCVPQAGTAGPVADCALFDSGGSTITLVYRAIIQDDYAVTFPSGDQSVDEGDILVNDVVINGDLLDVQSLAPTGSSEADDSSEQIAIQQGTLTKEIYAINGSTTLPTPLQIGPGDTVTYRLTLTLPTSDVEPLEINDFLPLPIFDATSVSTTFDPTVSAAAPPSGQSKFGPSDTFFAESGLVPTMSTSASGNSVTWNYVEFDSPTAPSTVIDILFTVTASDDPFADGLYLTNQANAVQDTTQLEATTRNAIVQIQLTEPDVVITKGVVSTDNTAADTYAPLTVGPVAFNAPGTAGARFVGTISSGDLTSTPINSNVSGIDAGDLVTFAIVLENQGSGVNGAFDVRIRDTMPTGFQIPGSGAGLNLRVTDGAGNVITPSNIGTGLFDPAGGIELPDTGTGSIAESHPSSGANIIVITYDLELTSTVSPEAVLTNTATLFNFAGAEGAPDHTTVDRTDDATVTIAEPALTKTRTGTNQAHTANALVAVGEQITYDVVVRVPEGEAASFVLQDTMATGLAIVSLNSLTASAGVTTSVGGGFPAALAAAVISNPGGASPLNDGRRVTINLGTVTNSDTDDAVNDTITLNLTAVVINAANAARGSTLGNSATATYTGGTASSNNVNVTVVEPGFTVTKVANPTTGDAGDDITFTITVTSSNVANTATAFDVQLADTLPAGLTIQSAVHTSGLAPDSGPSIAANGFTASWNQFATGTSSVFTVVGTLGAVASGQVLTNTANLQFTSLPTDVFTTQSSNNALAVERTGNIAHVGTTENDYRSSGSANVTGNPAVPTKTILSTNVTQTTLNNVAVGERVQYQVVVEVPEGVNNTVTLVDTLPIGMAFYSLDGVTESSGDLTTSVGSFATVLANAQASGITNVGGGAQNDARRVTFNLGTVTNSDSDNGAGTAETITFTYTAVVLNVSQAVRGATLTNTATWSSSGSSAPVASPPSVIVVEPTLQVTKTVGAPATGDAGDVKTFTLVVSHTGASNGPAFNAELRDAIPAGMTYVPASATHTGGVAPTSLNFAAGELVATFNTLLVGETSTITFQATLNSSPAVTPGQTITNTATVTWTSLPGDVTSAQTANNSFSVERTGNPANVGGALNSYSANDSEDVTVHESTLAGFVYIDSNNNGVRDGGEPGIAGVAVRLTGTDHLGNAVDVVVNTNGSGAYSFTGLRPGTYQVQETQPAGYTDGLESIGTPALGATAGNDIFTTIAFPTGADTDAVDFNFGEVTSSELSITKTGTPHTVAPGGQIIYTLEFTNNGPNAAVNAVITDPLPAGTAFVSMSSAAGWSCSTPAVAANGVVSCTNPSMGVGTQLLTVTVQADAGLAPHSVIHNVATITSQSADIKPENNRDDERTVVGATGDGDLGVAKTDNVDPVQVGQQVSYNITVTNHGPTATDATVTDTLPAGLNFVSATPFSGTCGVVNPVVCTIPGMAPGASVTITIVADAMAAGTVTNTVSVTGTAPDPNPSNDSASEPTTIINASELDLSIVKTGPATVARGATLVYTHVVRNNGAAAANSVEVNDPLAIAGLTFLNNSGDCATAWPCVIGTMNPGDTLTIISTYAVDPAYAGPDPIVNTSTVATPDAESNLTNNMSQWTTRVFNASDADLSIVKLDSPDATVAGTLLGYTLIVTNNGPAAATGVAVNDTLPTGVTLVSSTISTGGSCTGTTSLSCAIGNLGVGGVATISLTVQTPSALPTPNPIVNTATVTSTSTDPEPANDQDDEPTTIVAQTDVEIAKSAPASVVAGNQLVYTITVTNNGPSDAADVTVNDATPTGLVFLGNAGACTTAFPCSLGTVEAGQSRVITATFLVPSSYAGANPIVNNTDVTTTTTETNALNNSDTASTNVTFDADLAITKSGPATAAAGDTIVYTTVVTNNGPSDAILAQVIDPTPANLVFTSNTGDCVSAFPCTFTTIPAGASRTITSSYLVPPNYTTPDPIENVAAVSSNTPDSDPSNNTDNHLTTLGPPSADIAVVKIGPATTVPGNPIVYTITVTNNGPSDAANVELTDPAPANLTFVSNAGDCATVFPCALGTLPAGQSRVITTTFMVPANYTSPSQITNVATVTTTTTDPNLANNTSTAVSSVGADLVVTKVVDDTTPNVTDVVTFTVTLRNAGPSATTGVALVDAIPAGLTLLSATPSEGAYDESSGTWTVGNLAVDQTVTLAVQARVIASGPITNTATVTASDLYDPDTSNNTAGASINSASAADLQVLKTVDRAAASVDTNVVFTITVRNAGPDPATSVALTDVLPAGLSFVSATASAGSYNAANGVWTVGDLPLNVTETLTMTARVDATGTTTNTASVTARDQFDPAPANDASGVSVNGLSADVQVVKTVDRTVAGINDPVTFTITVTNNGPGEATNVRVRDQLPAAFAYISSSASQGIYIPETGIWSVGPLGAPGGGTITSATLQITALVVASGGAANTATVMGLDQPDPNPANDVTSVGMDGGTIDLEAGLTFIGDGDAVGRLFDFFISVTNRGVQRTLDPLTLAIPFPAELSFNAPQTSWPCEAVGRTLFCEHALETPLDQGQSKTLGYWADVLKVFPRGLAAYAHVLSPRDPNVTNNVGSVLVTPPTPAGGTADLRISQSIVAGGQGVAPTVTYRVEVVNDGPGAAHEVTLIDMLSAGLGLVSITAEDNAAVCAGTRKIACTLGPNGSGTLAPGERVVLTIVADVQPTAYGLIAHTVSVSGREPDVELANNATRITFTRAAATNPTTDTDGDNMTDLWESQMGLDPSLADGAGDADGDGVSNAQEFLHGTHPRGFHRQFFAEGAANAFFGTMFSLVNPSTTNDAMVTLGLMRDTGEMTTTPIPLRAMHRHDAVAQELLGNWAGSFSALLESDQPIASHRLMWWDASGYGTTLEAAASAPATRWLFAEGATHGFNLFYLLQNQDMLLPADVTIRYLLKSGAPVIKTYAVPPHSRLTIYVNEIPELAGQDVSAEVISSLPIVAERAMYRDSAGVTMAAGHVGRGATAAATTWLFAEGATGDFLNMFLLLANPGAITASVEIRYLLPDGTVITKPYSVGPNARVTVDVANEDQRLAATSVGMTVTSTEPIVAERAMWWPGWKFAPDWYEAHVVLGATEAGTKWALATGAAGGPIAEQTFVLVANQASVAGTIRVTAVFDDGTTRVKELPIAATARMTLDVASEFPDAVNRAFSVIVESIGASPVPLVVEGSRYGSPNGQLWGAGGAALATRLQ